MAFTSVPTVATGDLWTASNQNTYLRDNMAALWPYSAAGDIGIASAADALGRLAAPVSVGQGIISDPSEALKMKWKHVLPVLGYVSVNNIQTSSLSYVDMTGVSISLPLLAASTVILIAAGTGYSVNHTYYLRGVIDGVADSSHVAIKTVDVCDIPIGYVFRRTGIAAGTRVIKMQHMVSTHISETNRINMIAIAIPE